MMGNAHTGWRVRGNGRRGCIEQPGRQIVSTHFRGLSWRSETTVVELNPLRLCWCYVVGNAALFWADVSSDPRPD